MPFPFISHTSDQENNTAQMLAGLRAGRRELTQQVAQYERNRNMAGHQEKALAAIALKCEGFAPIAARCEHAMQQLKQQKLELTKARRIFEYEHQITRPVRTPDRYKTAFMAGVCMLVEGMLGGVLLIADGHFGIAEGMATGFGVAATNIITSLVTGYYAGRYAGYKVGGRNISASDRFKRACGRAGLVVGAGVIALLHFGAARVRVTGSHSGIFDFAQVGFLETVTDYFAIALLALGAAGSLIAFMKGRHGISDPIVGYSEIVRDTEFTIAHMADSLHQAAMAQAEGLYQELHDRLDMLEASFHEAYERINTDFMGLNESIAAFNDDIKAAIETLQAQADTEQHYQQFIIQKAVDARCVDVTALQALRMKPLEPCSTHLARYESMASDIDNGFNRLQERYQQAIHVIEAAYASFLSQDYAFTLHPVNTPSQED